MEFARVFGLSSNSVCVKLLTVYESLTGFSQIDLAGVFARVNSQTSIKILAVFVCLFVCLFVRLFVCLLLTFFPKEYPSNVIVGGLCGESYLSPHLVCA